MSDTVTAVLPDLAGQHHELCLELVDPQHERLLVECHCAELGNVLDGLSQQLGQCESHLTLHRRQPLVDLAIFYWHRREELHL